MGRLHTIGKTIITVYANDHLPPNFHIVHPDFEALIIIETFATYVGELKGSAGKAPLQWASANVATIKAEWNRVNPRFPVKKRRKMEKELPRIEAVTVELPSTLRIRWRGKRAADTVNLSGWIATGGDILAPLRNPAVFARAAITNYGAAVGWDDDNLTIDAMHLKALADDQKPFTNNDVKIWQNFVKLSNSEAAELLDVSVSTWNSYKTSATIPRAVAIALRAALRDPLVVQAHLRPRTAGRPRKEAAGTND